MNEYVLSKYKNENNHFSFAECEENLRKAELIGFLKKLNLYENIWEFA
jgi:hypothetical protein